MKRKSGTRSERGGKKGSNMSDSFKDFVFEQLGSLNVKARSMFGAFGLYLDGKFFAIIDSDQLFFKTNDQTRKDYEAYASKPFAPTPKQVLKNYYEVPAEIIDNPETLQDWARKASEV